MSAERVVAEAQPNVVLTASLLSVSKGREGLACRHSFLPKLLGACVVREKC